MASAKPRLRYRRPASGGLPGDDSCHPRSRQELESHLAAVPALRRAASHLRVDGLAAALAARRRSAARAAADREVLPRHQMPEQLTPKRASESATEMVQVVLPNDANPLGFILGGTRHAPDRHRRRHRLPSPHAHAAGDRRGRRPAVPAPDQGRRPDHPQGARDGRLEHVARSRSRSLLGGDPDRPAPDDEPRLPDLRRDRRARGAGCRSRVCSWRQRRSGRRPSRRTGAGPNASGRGGNWKRAADSHKTTRMDHETAV